MSECKCTLSQSLGGDGCDECNPKQALEFARETIAEQALEIEKLEAKIHNYKELAEAVAHIGVDFGFGEYALEDKWIEQARALLNDGELT